MEPYVVIGFIFTIFDTIGDIGFTVDAYIVMTTINEMNSYDSKIYDMKERDELTVASVAAIVFCVVGIVMIIFAFVIYFGNSSPNKEQKKKDAITIYNNISWGTVDVPMYLITLYFSFNGVISAWTWVS
eukprot:401254_1